MILSKSMKCPDSKHGYHDPKKIKEYEGFEKSIDELHQCQICGEKRMFRKIPNGEYYNDEEYYQFYAKDFLQPHHEDYRLVYGDPTEIIEKDKKHRKQQKHIENTKGELETFKKHKKNYVGIS